MTERRIVIMGAGGRDFHDFNVVFRDDPDTVVVAFTAAQIPGIDRRRYPPVLAGPRYPDGIPIRPEEELDEIIRREDVDEVVFAYSDLSHVALMHRASAALAAGADFRLLGPRTTMLTAPVPVVAVCATRTGAGKSPISRRVGAMLRARGLRVALVRHPMPYGDLARQAVQRFSTPAEIDAADPTVEEREEYERPVELGMVVFAGVDYEAILARAATESDVIIWDGGNNDSPFFAPDLLVVVTDARRAGEELDAYPGEVNLRMADVVVVNKVDVVAREAVERVRAAVRAVRPSALVVETASPVTLDDGPSLAGRRVLVVEDGPTITHGGLPDGAGAAAARAAGALFVDPRPWAVGSIAETFARFPHIGPVLPAMGYSPAQVDELAATVRAADCDAVIAGTPIDLAGLFAAAAPAAEAGGSAIRHPIRRASYESVDVDSPTLADALAPFVERLESRTG